MKLQVLKIGTRSFEASEERVSREGDRMFKMNPEKRARRADAAKTRLSRAVGASGFEADKRNGAVKQATAILLCQGVREI